MEPTFNEIEGTSKIINRDEDFDIICEKEADTVRQKVIE